MFSKQNRKKTILILLFLTLILGISRSTLSADIRALWVTAWDINTPEKIDKMVEFALDHNINQIFAHVRYRSDALYFPNRFFDTYDNPEPRSYILNGNYFDPLAYLLDITKETDLEIHAWVTVFVATPRTIENIADNHLYKTRNEWFTRDFLDTQMSYNSYEGAYLDPGVPEVQDYLINVFLDIVNNYPVKGIQLDYIRYPDSQFGHNPVAIESFHRSGYNNSQFHQWKEEQINRFVRRFYAEIKYHDPELIVSAAVISDLNRARMRYSQNWTEWLEEGYLDYAYIMSYSPVDEVVQKELDEVKKWKERIIVGLRAWAENNRPYSPDLVSSKISISKKLGFPGIALFSYSGIRANNNPTLTNALTGKNSPATTLTNNFIFGYVTYNHDIALPRIPVYLNDGKRITFTDENGFFFFNHLKPGNYSLKADKGINVLFSSTIGIPATNSVFPVKYNLSFPEMAKID